MREMTAETDLAPSMFIMPMFVVPGKGIKEEIPSMPGIFHLSVDVLLEECEAMTSDGVKTVILFGICFYLMCFTGS